MGEITAQKSNYKQITLLVQIFMLFHAFSQELEGMVALLTGAQVIDESWRCQMIASSISTHIGGS